MRPIATVYENCKGGFYEHTRCFTEAKWASIARLYEVELDASGKCTIRGLADLASISYSSTRKVIDYYDGGSIKPPKSIRGHGLQGVGSLLHWEMKQHIFLYNLYRNNASFPVDGYVEEFCRRFGVIVSKYAIERWFLTIGPFKGSMRVTSRYPSGRNSWATYNML